MDLSFKKIFETPQTQFNAIEDNFWLHDYNRSSTLKPKSAVTHDFNLRIWESTSTVAWLSTGMAINVVIVEGSSKHNKNWSNIKWVLILNAILRVAVKPTPKPSSGSARRAKILWSKVPSAEDEKLWQQNTVVCGKTTQIFLVQVRSLDKLQDWK